MRIISQKGTTPRSYNFDQIEIKQYDCSILAGFKDGEKILGIYVSPERADSVFTEIHKSYAAGQEIYILPDT